MVIQVIQYRRYPQPMNIRAKQMIEKVGGTFLGIVLNNINMSQDESYYYYSGYYHDYYYYSKNEEEQEAEAEEKGKPAANRPKGNQTKVLIAPSFFARISPDEIICSRIICLRGTGCRLGFDRLFLGPRNPRLDQARVTATAATQPAPVARFHVGDTVTCLLFRRPGSRFPDSRSRSRRTATSPWRLSVPLRPSARPPANSKPISMTLYVPNYHRPPFGHG